MAIKKVAFFVISTHLGGAERSLLDYLKNCPKNTMDIVVIVPKTSGPLINELIDLQIQTLSLNLPEWLLKVSRKKTLQSLLKLPLAFVYFPILIKKIQTLLIQNKIDVVHSTGLKFHILLMFACKRLDVQLFIHLRDIIASPILKNIFFKLGTAKNIHFLANSKATAESIAPLDANLIYNGFDTSHFCKIQSTFKQQQDFSDSDRLIAIIGVIARWKGQREFIEAAALVLQTTPNAYFLIIGDEIYDTSGEDGELSFLKTRVAHLGIEKNFRFINFQKDLVPIYSDIDVLVHASIQPEPFGRVIVEAMLCQCAVTASNQGGPLEIIKPGKNGLLHDSHSPEEIAANIISLLQSKNLRHSLAAKAKESAQSFSMDNYCERLTQAILAPPHF